MAGRGTWASTSLASRLKCERSGHTQKYFSPTPTERKLLNLVTKVPFKSSPDLCPIPTHSRFLQSRLFVSQGLSSFPEGRGLLPPPSSACGRRAHIGPFRGAFSSPAHPHARGEAWDAPLSASVLDPLHGTSLPAAAPHTDRGQRGEPSLSQRLSRVCARMPRP